MNSPSESSTSRLRAPVVSFVEFVFVPFRAFRGYLNSFGSQLPSSEPLGESLLARRFRTFVLPSSFPTALCPKLQIPLSTLKLLLR